MLKAFELTLCFAIHLLYKVGVFSPFLTSFSNRASEHDMSIHREIKRTWINYSGSSTARVTQGDHPTTTYEMCNHSTRARHKLSRLNDNIFQLEVHIPSPTPPCAKMRDHRGMNDEDDNEPIQPFIP